MDSAALRSVASAALVVTNYFPSCNSVVAVLRERARWHGLPVSSIVYREVSVLSGNSCKRNQYSGTGSLQTQTDIQTGRVCYERVSESVCRSVCLDLIRCLGTALSQSS